MDHILFHITSGLCNLGMSCSLPWPIGMELDVVWFGNEAAKYKLWYHVGWEYGYSVYVT